MSDEQPTRAAGPAEVIRVLIADDQALFRRGLYVVLGTEDSIEVVAEAENGEEAIERAEELAPDVVLMDVRMPKINGIESARAIRASVPTTKILMLTVSDEEDDLYISENTVKNHVRNILEKLHLHNRMEAVIYAVKERLLDIRDDA